MPHPVSPRPGATEGPGPLSALERAVLTVMLRSDGPSEALAALRAQLANATVISRTHSGVGFVTRIDVPDALPSAPESTLPPLRPVLAAHPQLAERAEFLLQLRAGRLGVLEAYCVVGRWPADESDFRMVG